MEEGNIYERKVKRDQNVAMGEQEVSEWVPEGTHADYVSDQGSEQPGFVPDTGNEPGLVTKLPESYGPARNRVQRGTDPDSDCRDHL